MLFPEGPIWVRTTDDPLEVGALETWAQTSSTGAVVTFRGVIRDHSVERASVVALTYSSYEGHEDRVLSEVATEVLRAHSTVERLGIWHRLGRVELGETALAVVVACPHRAQAFAACEMAVNHVKASVPIWKYEHSTGGDGWVGNGLPIQDLVKERG